MQERKKEADAQKKKKLFEKRKQQEEANKTDWVEVIALDEVSATDDPIESSQEEPKPKKFWFKK